MTYHHPALSMDWWWTYAAAVRNAALAQFRNRHSCIETVRVGIAVGDYFDVEVVPVAVLATMHTPDNWAAIMAGEENPPGWSVGTAGTGGVDAARNRWDGHLLAVGAGTVIMDLSADQFARPERGLPVPGPIVVTDANPTGRLAAGMGVTDEVTGVVWAATASGDERWRDAPAWRSRESVIRRCAGVAIRAIRDGG